MISSKEQLASAAAPCCSVLESKAACAYLVVLSSRNEAGDATRHLDSQLSEDVNLPRVVGLEWVIRQGVHRAHNQM